MTHRPRAGHPRRVLLAAVAYALTPAFAPAAAQVPRDVEARLEPWRPGQFRIRACPDVVVSFALENGKVTAMSQRDPSGEHLFPRVP